MSKNPKVLFYVAAIKKSKKKNSSQISYNVGQKIAVLRNNEILWFGYVVENGPKKSGYFDPDNVFQISDSFVDSSQNEKKNHKNKNKKNNNKNDSNLDEENSQDLGMLLNTLENNKGAFKKNKKKNLKAPVTSNGIPPKPSGKKPKIRQRPYGEKLSILQQQEKSHSHQGKSTQKKPRITGELYLHNNFTWQGREMEKITFTVETFIKTNKPEYIIKGMVDNENLSVCRQGEDFKLLGKFLLEYQPLSIPVLNTKNKNVPPELVFSNFLNTVVNHPVLWYTDCVKCFLDLHRMDWVDFKKNAKGINNKTENLEFLTQINPNFKYKNMMQEYKKSIIYFQKYLNTVEKSLKQILHSWTNNLQTETVMKKNLKKFSNSFENFKNVGLEWREPKSYKNQDLQSTLQTETGIDNLVQAFSNATIFYQASNTKNTQFINFNINSLNSEITGFKHLFQRMEQLQNKVKSHHQKYLKATHSSNYKTAQSEKNKMKSRKAQLNLFQLSMLAESELFRQSLLTKMNSTLEEFLENEIKCHKKTAKAYQKVLDSVKRIKVEKGAVYNPIDK
ncbi:sorting nexin [Anaeramoeba flamelloides]|uniref:Sorting nexin n=1 Tax=Anaeramoeba flamelloides TaxID=1746091 RepID=A0ABQ8Z8Z5_9EUKA|nr:sorting nexin [Anaeramoeba flamelloides]